MTGLLHIATLATVMTGVAAIAIGQQQPGQTNRPSDTPITVTGCLDLQPAAATDARTGEGSGTPPGSATAVQSTTTHPGQRPGGVHGSATAHAQAGAQQYVLRVGDTGTTGATPRTGMPTATPGMMDERLEAGKIGTTLYQVTAADRSVDLAPHVQHTVEITGRVMASGAAAGQTAARGAASPTQSPSQAGTSGAASPATGAVPTAIGNQIEGGIIEVTALKMIADSCS